MGADGRANQKGIAMFDFELKVTTRHFPLLVLRGEMNVEVAPIVERMLFAVYALEPKRLLVDASGLTYISSSGLRAFFDLNRKMTSSGGILSVYGLKPSLQKVIEIARILPLEKIFANMNDADAYLKEFILKEEKRGEALGL